MKLTTYMRFCTFILLLFVAFLSPNAHAIVYRTDPFGFGGDWDDGSTWQNGLVPPDPLLVGDEIIITTNDFFISVDLTSSKTIQGTLTIESSGSLIIDGGSITNSGTVTVQGDGFINIQSGGSLTNDGTLTVEGQMDVFDSFTSTGTFNLSGYLVLRNTPTSLPGGTFNWNSGSTIQLLENTNLTLNTPLTIEAGRELEIRGVFINNSDINVEGTLDFHSNNTFTNNGTLNLNSGGRLFYNYPGATPPPGTLNWTSGGIIESHYSCNLMLNAPLTIPSGGILQISGIVTNNSTLTNQGIIKTDNFGFGDRELVQNGTFTNSGSIAPGSSPGRLDVTGDLDLGTGTYNCEINGTGQGTTYDLLAVTGNATLTNANLVVDWGTFTPSAGETFTVMTFGSRIGTFNSVTIPPISGLSFTSSYTGSDVIITAALLPVELVSFSAEKTREDILLNWQTASELNNAGFQLQRSANGKNWDDLTFIPGYGTTQKAQSYTYTDERPLPGLNYYRLRQEDFDGTTEFSKVVSIAMERAGGDISLYPNPATSTVTITLQSDYIGEATISLYDFTGKQVKTETLSLSGGALSRDIGLLDLPAGVYLAEVQAGNRQWRERLVVE